LLQKVVLARQVDWQAPAGTRFDAGATAVALRDQQPDCTVFLVAGPGVGVFVGASPEELVRLCGGQVRTVALAGTARRLAEEAADAAAARTLLSNEKDREEHRLVAQALRESLAPLSTELQGNEAPQVASFADVHHLRTEFQATLKEGASLFDLLEGLHPTPAVGGLPNREALEWIQAHELRDRGWYAAPVGWVDARGEGVFVVAIRSALVRGDRATAFAGCGLVSASDPVQEWDEALAKIRTVRQGIVHRPDEA
jgi:isochorismate synthase